MKTECQSCKIEFQAYWLKNGRCNGCRNPHLIVKAIPYNDLRIQAIEHFEHLDPKEVSEQMIEDEIALRLSLITHTEK